MPYTELIAKLNEIEYRPWLDRTRRRLSAILTPLGIEKQHGHIDRNHVRWGYTMKQFTSLEVTMSEKQ
jgi:hypothetical protein